MSGTYMRDYAHMSDDEAAACAEAARNGRRQELVDEPIPQGWRLNLLSAGTIVGVLLMLVGGVCLGILFGTQPESDGLTDAQMWTQNADLMAESAFAVIALFLGAQTLLFTAAGHFATRMFLALLRELAQTGNRAVQSYGDQIVRLPSPEIAASARRVARALFRSESRRAQAGDITGDTEG